MERDVTKANRLIQFELLLLAHPDGLTQAEIARRLCIHRSTVHRYLTDLPGYVYEESGKLYIDRAASLINVQFTLHEAMSVHLAARLLTTVMDRQNPHAASMLRKLGIALERLAPHISRHLDQSANAIDTDVGWQDPNYLRVLETLTLAWAEGRQVEIWHRKGQGELVKRYRFSTYYIEPGAVNRAVYVMGNRTPPGEVRTFKVERIERIEMLNETYQIPPEFEPKRLLNDAWGIWYTEAEPVEVVLKFSARVRQRVRKSHWHRSEQVVELEDGGLLWRAMVAEPQEMLP